MANQFEWHLEFLLRKEIPVDRLRGSHSVGTRKLQLVVTHS